MLQKDLQKKNWKVAGILLNSVITTKAKGQLAFYLIEKFHNVSDGFAGGHFYREWKALEKKRDETTESKKLEDLKA